MVARIRVEPDKDSDGQLFWTATADWDDSPEYDASGPDPAYALAALAEVLLNALHASDVNHSDEAQS